MDIGIYGFIFYKRAYISIPQVAVTANQIDKWILVAAGDVNSLVSRQILR